MDTVGRMQSAGALFVVDGLLDEDAASPKHILAEPCVGYHMAEGEMPTQKTP